MRKLFALAILGGFCLGLTGCGEAKKEPVKTPPPPATEKKEDTKATPPAAEPKKDEKKG